MSTVDHSPLVSAAELRDLLADPAPPRRIRLADVRWYLGRPGAGREAHAAGHIDGAVFVDLDADLSAPAGPGRHPLPDPAAFAARLGSLGFGSADLVVAYDDVGGGVAGRLWWMLDALGHPAVRVLDGGIGAWVASGGGLESVEVGHSPATLALGGEWPRTIDRDTLRGRLGSVRLLDVRAPERYRGEVEPVDRVPGHIPTAINVPIAGNLGPDGRFLEPAALRARFEAIAFDGPPDAPTVVSCGSGTNACQALVAFRLAGLPDPVLYPGSWSDWSGSYFPVATGDAPGAAPSDPTGDPGDPGDPGDGTIDPAGDPSDPSDPSNPA